MKNRITGISLIIGIVSMTIAIARWATTVAILIRQRAVADAYIQDKLKIEGVSGLETAPELLKRVFLAAGEHDAMTSGIILFSLGSILVLFSSYLYFYELRKNSK